MGRGPLSGRGIVMGRGPSIGRGRSIAQGPCPPRGTGPPAGYPLGPRQHAGATAVVDDMFEDAPLITQYDVDQVDYIGASAVEPNRVHDGNGGNTSQLEEYGSEFY